MKANTWNVLCTFAGSVRVRSELANKNQQIDAQQKDLATTKEKDLTTKIRLDSANCNMLKMHNTLLLPQQQLQGVTLTISFL